MAKYGVYIIDHHNSFTTRLAVGHTASVQEVGNLIVGLRFYRNVYINYQSDKELFDENDAPSWSNQDCIIYWHDDRGGWSQFEERPNDGWAWCSCDEPDLMPHMAIGNWTYHEIG